MLACMYVYDRIKMADNKVVKWVPGRGFSPDLIFCCLLGNFVLVFGVILGYFAVERDFVLVLGVFSRCIGCRLWQIDCIH